MMATWVQPVTADELQKLRDEPASINQLDKPKFFRTHWMGPLNYLLTGSAWPDSHPLAGVLFGSESIATPTLENGAFGVCTAEQVAAISSGLNAVDQAALIASVSTWDVELLTDEEEMYELEVIPLDELEIQLKSELEGLVAFYQQTADAGDGVAMYTS